jgi:NAD(P)-dependent dehydrogenase (short-subunit alcohol dehydrogenase family)
MKLKDRVAIVTGGAHGIGEAVVNELANEGARIAVVDIDGEGANAFVQELSGQGKNAIAIQADVTRLDDVKAMVAKVVAELGEVDILVNNAGGGDKPAPVWEKSPEQWHAAISLTLHSAFYCCHEVVGSMVKRNKGRVINISSCSGLVGIGGMAGYSSGKAALYGFTRALAKEVGRYGVTVNTVSPGPIGTEALLRYCATDEKVREGYLQAAGVGRLGKPEEVGALVAFLASDEAGFITGQDHVIGGLRNLGF